MSSDQVDAIVERIGFGKQQVLVLIPGGFAYAASAAVTVGAAQAARASANVAGRRSYNAGLLTSILFGGYLVGNLLSGPFSDRHGRRIPLMASFAGLALSQALVAILGGGNFFFLATFFWGCGIFMGLGLSGANANMKEWTPTHLRSTLFCMLFVFLTFGQLAVGIFLSVTSPDLTPERLQWKLLFALQSLVSGTLLIFTAALLPESPQWLKHNKMFQEAKKELTSAATRNGAEIDEKTIQDALGDTETDAELNEATALNNEVAKSQSILGNGLLATTIIGCYLNFVTNACYYGLLCTLPATLSDSFKGTGIAAANVMVLSMLFELPGIILQDFLGHSLSRQINLATAFAFVSVALAILAGGLNWRASGIIILGSMTAKLTIIASFIITYLALAEAYPIACRATGSGFCMAVGRLGAVIAPLLYEAIGDSSFYIVLCVLALIAAVASCWMRLLHE